MNYTITTDDDQEAGLTLARQRNPDYVSKTNQEYLDFVMNNVLESYIEQASQSDFDKLREAYKLGHQETVQAVNAAIPVAEQALVAIAEAEQAAREQALAEQAAAEQAAQTELVAQQAEVPADGK